MGDSSSLISKPESKSRKSKKPKPVIESSHSAAPPNSSSGATHNRPLTATEKQHQQLRKMLDEMNEEGDGHAPPIVNLGAFTAKHVSVALTLDIIRQGRSTLVTTLQLFKILGPNCIAIAYVLSVMYLDGVKLEDI